MLDRKKLATIRSQFKSLNNQDLQQRLNKSGPIEKWILDTMNHYGVPVEGTLVKGWKKTTSRDDKTYKRDAMALHNGQYIYAQLKYRQPNSGGDIGVALLQPFVGREEVRQTLLHEREKMSYFWARDYVFDGGVYACLSNDWEVLYVVPYLEVVKPIVTKVFKEWMTDPCGYNLTKNNRVYRSINDGTKGCELRFKTDSGRNSWDSGENKVICYIPPALVLENPSVVKHEMVGPPDYIFN